MDEVDAEQTIWCSTIAFELHAKTDMLAYAGQQEVAKDGTVGVVGL